MPRVRVLRAHAMTNGIGVWRVGEVYDESPGYAEEKARAGFVEYEDGSEPLRTKQDPDMYRTRTFSVPATPVERPAVQTEAGVKLAEKSGNWYTFSDGEKVLGKRAAADYLGVSIEELEGIDVDPTEE